MNDVALDAFSEYGYKTAYIPKQQRGIAYATPPPFNP